MLIVERHQQVLSILREQKSAQLEALAEAMGVSVSTVRRDLEYLEAQGMVERTHGGAVYRGPQKHSFALEERLNENIDAKRAIGKLAADLIQPNMTVLLDGGSTVYLAAQQITARPLQVVTNSLLVAQLFADDEQIEIMLIGGNLYPRSGVLVGPIATRCLHDLHADILLFSLAGIYEDGAYNQNLAMAEVEQAMMTQAARSILLMDASKFGRKSLAKVCDIDDVEQIITDAAITDRYRKQFGDRLMISD